MRGLRSSHGSTGARHGCTHEASCSHLGPARTFVRLTTETARPSRSLARDFFFSLLRPRPSPPFLPLHKRVAHSFATRERSLAMSESTARVSPTAYYTGHVWCRNGLSHPALDTREGAALFTMLRPVMLAGRAVTRGVALEEMLLQR